MSNIDYINGNMERESNKWMIGYLERMIEELRNKKNRTHFDDFNFGFFLGYKCKYEENY